MPQQSQPIEIQLAHIPAFAPICFDLLRRAGADTFCLFGGAVRDMDYNHRNGTNLTIKDYDLRVWMPRKNFETSVDGLCSRLSELGATMDVPPDLLPAGAIPTQAQEFSAAKRALMPSGHGSASVKKIVLFQDKILDISIRGFSKAALADPDRSNAIAVSCAQGSSTGLCSIALTSELRTWVMPEYMSDRDGKKISIYPSQDTSYNRSYAMRLQQEKYRNHIIACKSPVRSTLSLPAPLMRRTA